MRSLLQPFVDFLRSEDGPTAVEYAVMLALIIVVCIGAIQILGTQCRAHKITAIRYQMDGDDGIACSTCSRVTSAEISF